MLSINRYFYEALIILTILVFSIFCEYNIAANNVVIIAVKTSRVVINIGGCHICPHLGVMSISNNR